MTTTMRKSPRHYAAEWRASAPVVLEECVQVHAFASRAARDAWLADGADGAFYGPDREVGTYVRTWSRERLTRREAARYLRAILTDAYGGRQSGYAALEQL